MCFGLFQYVCVDFVSLALKFIVGVLLLLLGIEGLMRAVGIILLLEKFMFPPIEEIIERPNFKDDKNKEIEHKSSNDSVKIILQT
jgi:hypothetical protein